jgi:thiol-disulfide isomerase/thioredoxin
MSRISILIATLLVALAGCGPAPDASVAARPTTPAATPTPTGSAADIGTALHDAATDGRPVLLEFGASWCPDCVALAHTFEEPTVHPVLAGFHLVDIDIGKFDRNLDLATRYGLDFHSSGIPALVVLSPEGRVTATTEDGSFADARTMTPDQGADQLRRGQDQATTAGQASFSEGGVDVTLTVHDSAVVATFRPQQPGFHIYSVDLPEGGVNGLGIPTRLAVRGGLTATGPPTADQPVRLLELRGLSTRLPVYPDGPVTLTLPVRRSGDSVEVVVSYGACSATQCLIPVTDHVVSIALH